MKALIIFLFMWMVVPAIPLMAQEQQVVPYTLADRDRAIRTEIKLEALETKVENKFVALEAKMDLRFAAQDTKFDTKIDAVNARIDYLFWLMGALFALVLFNLGYTIWVRRTALKPALEKADAADYRSLNISRALRDYAKDRPDLTNFLKTHGLL